MTLEEQVKMLREAVEMALASTRCRNETCDHSWHADGRAALAATAEPAPTYSAPQGEHEGCYGADDLRKVAEATFNAGMSEGMDHKPDDVEPDYAQRTRDLDAIIAKAVGRG